MGEFAFQCVCFIRCPSRQCLAPSWYSEGPAKHPTPSVSVGPLSSEQSAFFFFAGLVAKSVKEGPHPPLFPTP